MTIERINVRTSAEWHARRSRDVTASVVGALFGVHEFVTPYALWAYKSGRVEADPEETPAILRGQLLEPVAVKLLRRLRPKWKIKHNTNPGDYWRDSDARLGATPDVLATDPKRGRGIVQIKSVEQGVFRRKWLGESDTPEPPFWIAMQAVVEAYLTGSKWAAVAPIVVGHGIEMPIIEIPLLDGVIERVRARCREFWDQIETGEELIPDYSLDGDLIERMYAGVEGEEIDLTRDNQIYDLIAMRHRIRADAVEAEGKLAAIDAEIKHKLQGASIAHLSGGKKITWLTQKRAGYFAPPKEFRVLRIPPPDA
ncbi:YqaJ viral recombinase family protein [Ochrobactrum sp. GPK 3]